MTIDVIDKAFVGKLKVYIPSSILECDDCSDTTYIENLLAWSRYYLGVNSHIIYDYGNNCYVIKMSSSSVINLMRTAKCIISLPNITEIL